MVRNPLYETLILDLGDVLFRWSPRTRTTISPRTLQSILSSDTWFDYERGRIDQNSCYQCIAAEFCVDAEEVADAFRQARESLESNDELIALVHRLKAQRYGALRVFALSNISVPDYEYILTKPVDWTVLDKVFPSGLIGERKPDHEVYRHVISQTGINPHTTVFVDDKLENVEAARSFGITGIVFDEQADISIILSNLFPGPSDLGREYLRSNAKNLESFTDTGLTFYENFAQLLILELIGDEDLVTLRKSPRTWNFFRGKPLYSEHFPDDLDTTSLALTILDADPIVASDVMDEMLGWRNNDGIFLTYFDEARPRVDHVVNVNIVTLFYANGRGRQLDKSLAWICDILRSRGHLEGSRYYASPDLFLHFIGRLLAITDDDFPHAQLEDLLIERVRERVGVEGDTISLASRILVCSQFGITDDVDMRSLLSLQCEDKGWPVSWLYRFVKNEVMIGNRGVSTAFAIKAIDSVHPPLPRKASDHAHVSEHTSQL